MLSAMGRQSDQEALIGPCEGTVQPGKARARLTGTFLSGSHDLLDLPKVWFGVEFRGSITDPRMAGIGALRKLIIEIGCFRFCPIVLKNSLSAIFDFLGGLWARHSKNQLGDQPICRLGSVRGPQPV